jgi:uncharacterized SAM-binding protein YcdF (DUF218 family)
MAAAAAGLGFDPTRIVLADQSLAPQDEAQSVKGLVGEDVFVLVTTASHMLRAVKLFENAGLSPIPAPAYWRYKGEPEYFLPYPSISITATGSARVPGPGLGLRARAGVPGAP